MDTRYFGHESYRFNPFQGIWEFRLGIDAINTDGYQVSIPSREFGSSGDFLTSLCFAVITRFNPFQGIWEFRLDRVA